MLDITIPLYAMLAAVGLPILLLGLLMIRLLRLKLRRNERNFVQCQISQPQHQFEDFNAQIHQEILEQQIDAVFNVLVTVLETERVKLKALVTHSQPTFGNAPRQPKANPISVEKSGIDDSDEQQESEISIGQQVAGLSKEGMAAAEIAKRLGLSQSEITLALKMNSGRKGSLGKKVHAVA